MLSLVKFIQSKPIRMSALAYGLLTTLVLLGSFDAQALPLFARQTGQNCLACHAGGQFPELTPYGRMFKMTGYTIGTRTEAPISVMGEITAASVANTSKDPNPEQTFAKNGAPMFEGGSVFIGGKITDNIGAFTQITYNNYSGQAIGVSGNNDGRWQGQSAADNMDIRYADRLIDPGRDLVFGVSLNNDPSVSDPWNTAAAWMQYVPTPGMAAQFADSTTPYPNNAAGANVAGLTAYMFLNQSIYGELGFYRTANQVFSFMSAGTNDASTTHLQGANNPYWRLAYSHEWGAQNIMVGTSGMIAHVFDGSTDPSDSGAYQRVKSVGIDTQYQYLLDPHTVTVQAAYQRQTTDLSPNAIATAVAGGPPFTLFDDTLDVFRAKATYVYKAKYGGSVSFFNLSGPTNIASPAQTTGNASGNPATRGFTYEAFWLPIQNIRVGAQYTMYSKFNGASDNYDGFGRNARDNNTLLLYVWGAY